jgi:hypothetical protein
MQALPLNSSGSTSSQNPFEIDSSDWAPAITGRDKGWFPVEAIAFDHGWLVRVRQDSGVQTIAYELGPWHVGRKGVAVDSSPNTISGELDLHCGDDPLGFWPNPGLVLVPNRISTISPDGKPVVLERRRSDDALSFQSSVGQGAITLGTLGVVIGVPLTVIIGVGSSAALWRGLAFTGASLILAVTGVVLLATAIDAEELRSGTITVEPANSTQAPASSSAKSLSSAVSSMKVQFELPSLSLTGNPTPSASLTLGLRF